jgi:hypothetical protein
MIESLLTLKDLSLYVLPAMISATVLTLIVWTVARYISIPRGSTHAVEAEITVNGRTVFIDEFDNLPLQVGRYPVFPRKFGKDYVIMVQDYLPNWDQRPIRVKMGDECVLTVTYT